ncbi:MAG: MFS transporter [Gammaproteobacteria bacterium]|nr:MFS transporter [Gammaproteobacteria bacterium]
MTAQVQVASGIDKPSLLQAWLVCFFAGLFFLFEFIQLSSFDALNHWVQNFYHLKASQVGLLGSSFLWGNVLFLLPAGLLLDKFGPRKVILWSLGASVVGLAIFAYSHVFTLAFVGRLMSGIGNAFCFVSLVVLVSRWFPGHRQAFAMGILVNMAFLGGMFAHTPLVWLLETFGWGIVMTGNVIFGVIVMVLIMIFVRNEPHDYQHTSHVDAITFWQGFKKIFHMQNIGAGVYTSCLNLPIMVLCALWGMQYLQIVHHVTVVQASNIVSMIFFGSMIGSPLAGWLSDRMRRRKYMMWIGGILALVLCYPMCCMKQSLSVSELMFIFFSLGCVTSTQVVSYPLIAESNSAVYAGRACSLASMIIMGGGMCAQMIFGWLLNQHQMVDAVPTEEAFRGAMMMFPISIMLALLMLVFMKETFCKHHLER